MKQYKKSDRVMGTGNHFKNKVSIKSMLTTLVCLFTVYSYGQTWQIGYPNATDVTATFNNGTLTISGTGAMQDCYYNNSTLPWVSVKDKITNVVINNGVTTIGNYVFLDCTALTSIIIPSTVTSIGQGAFTDNPNLTDITVNWTTPLPINSDVFSWGVPVRNIKLHVPGGTEYVYAATPVWKEFDIIGVVHSTFVQESNHFRIEMDDRLLSITTEQLAVWLSDLDRVYEQYTVLTGGYTPSSTGEKLSIRCLPYEEVTAWARGGGNSIIWTQDYVPGTLTAFVQNGDWSFGILHEIGHNFDKSSEPNWVFNGEITANLKVIYALDVILGCKYDLGGKIVSSLQEAYDYFYNWTVQDDGDDDRYTDKITAAFINVARKYGWGVFTKAFKSYSDNSYPYTNCNFGSAGKYNEFVDRLEYFSGSKDIRSECFNNGNWLATIEKHYPRTSQNTWQIGYPNSTDITSTFENGTLTINGDGAMQDWGKQDWTESPWYCLKDKITNAVINNGVTTLGSRALAYCNNLAYVSLPNTITTIGDYAFDNCTGLTSINIPNSVTTIGNWAFSTTEITSLDIPNSVTYIGREAFGWLSGILTDVTVHWGTPLILDQDPFAPYTDVSKINLHIPNGTYNLYAAAPVWKNFFNIYTSIDQIDTTNFNVYPNPAKNELTVERDNSNMGKEIVQVIDFSGRIVIISQFEPSISQLKIDVSHLQSGIYLLKIGNYRSKFIKE